LVNSKEIKAGVIGYNDGNGHPYSFSAIVNGFDEYFMSKCQYPVIYEYLSKRDSTDFGVDSLNVTHVWCDDYSIALDIANCSRIPKPVSDLELLLESVDVVIIARDDYNSHAKLHRICSKYEIPIFIDKPLCNTLDDLNYFKDYLSSGKLMSCSGFRYHPAYENCHTNSAPNLSYSLLNGDLDWFKYGIHMLEGIRSFIKSDFVEVKTTKAINRDIITLWQENGSESVIIRDYKVKLFKSTYIDNKNQSVDILYNDNFTYFKTLLHEIVNFVKTGTSNYDYNETLNLIKTLIAVEKSFSTYGQRLKV